jgi:hypothetical protein
VWVPQGARSSPIFPFVVIATGRNQLGPALREIGILRLVIAIAAYVMVLILHGRLFRAPLV